MVQVKNVTTAQLSLPPVDGIPGGGKRLEPGINNIASHAYWEAVKGRKPCATWIEQGKLEVTYVDGDKVQPEGQPKHLDLRAYTLRDAVDTVQRENDANKLVGWLKSEHRVGVVNAATRRLEALGYAGELPHSPTPVVASPAQSVAKFDPEATAPGHANAQQVAHAPAAVPAVLPAPAVHEAPHAPAPAHAPAPHETAPLPASRPASPQDVINKSTHHKGK